MRAKARKAAHEVAKRYEQLRGSLNERSRRLFAASEALAYGYGGITMVSEAIGIAPSTIGRGLVELRALEAGTDLGARIRRPGAGRKKATEHDPTLLDDLRKLVEGATRGDPESPLLWTARSLRNLVTELEKLGHPTSTTKVSKLLKELGYSLQANRKRQEGAQHPDRNAQFENINEKVRAQHDSGGPALSVDTKKKENVGNYKNAGRELRPQGEPEDVKVHDFIDPELGKVAPYGVYDLAKNEAWVSVGVNHDTAEFSVNTIRLWWQKMGKTVYALAASLLIIADSGGSNGYRLRLWKVQLQRLADEIGKPISVSHLPPGTSKWNKIEHRLFSFITQNWRGKPLITHQVIVDLIASTTTKTGLTVRCELDSRLYAKGRRVTDKELDAVNLVPDDFHGEWNYTIYPSNHEVDRLVS
jgi:transposase